MEPILFNARKHHLRTMAGKVREMAQSGTTDEKIILEELIPGEGVVDIYEGDLTAGEIEAEIYGFLQKNNLLERAAYQNYLETQGDCKRVGHYLAFTLSDTSVVTLRSEGFYKTDDPHYFVHVHPARHSPHTFRVPTNRLKTALFAYFLALTQRQSPYDLALVNEARQKMDLSPIQQVEETISDLIKKLEMCK